ncbi:tRNA-2-methylthio-N(6)-dimethylallyladenosine synthase [Clostridia bacterium]|nr:tRNA-2-methylthio-N(6)-dimethylallyladenosine synthase [Clostridia bacterium]
MVTKLQAVIDELKGRSDRPRTFAIVTYGCQMNTRDGETMAGILRACGLEKAARDSAEFLLYNTCCVRDNAERRARGNILWALHRKRSAPRLLIGVCGCMAQESGGEDEARRMFPGADIVFGTHNLQLLPEYLLRAMDEREPVTAIWEQAGSDEDAGDYGEFNEIAAIRPQRHKSFVIAMRGCDNFCSYCIVPYVRGRERSREPDEILREVEGLLADGVQEIMLLGQNINSYGRGLSNLSSGSSVQTFARILRRVAELGVPRIRFMTSHPKDLSDELIDAMASIKAVCNHIHLPVQSGSNRILQLMNRCYNRERYLERVSSLRKAIPEVGITTDLIVGFPGETEADFLETLSLVDEVGFDAAYTFVYSPRAGTRAAELPDRLPEAVSRERILRLIATQEAQTAKVLNGLVGTRQIVLADESARRNSAELSGKIERGIAVSFPGGAGLIGQFLPIRITSAGHNTLRGVIEME